MIVITSLNPSPRHVLPGDKFCLVIKDPLGAQVMVEEEITVAKTIDFIASFRFALDDGTCPGFHLTGVFANKAELPKELAEAVMLEDLTDEQYERFAASVGVKVERKTDVVQRVIDHFASKAPATMEHAP